jgi:hypothetical protein
VRPRQALAGSRRVSPSWGGKCGFGRDGGVHLAPRVSGDDARFGKALRRPCVSNNHSAPPNRNRARTAQARRRPRRCAVWLAALGALSTHAAYRAMWSYEGAPTAGRSSAEVLIDVD